VTVLAATYFKNNAEMIEACAKLKFIDKRMSILDPTFGNGLWWTKWKPARLYYHDFALDGVDFRNLPYPDNRFDAIAFDPPYVSAGGRESTTIKKMYDAYGMKGAPTSPLLLQRLINRGLRENYRVVRPAKMDKEELLRGGIVLVKCMDYVSSGQLWSGTYWTERYARRLGFRIEDKLIHVKKSGGPQPKGRTRKLKTGEVVPSRQQHAAHNASMLLVLRKVA